MEARDPGFQDPSRARLSRGPKENIVCRLDGGGGGGPAAAHRTDANPARKPAGALGHIGRGLLVAHGRIVVE